LSDPLSAAVKQRGLTASARSALSLQPLEPRILLSGTAELAGEDQHEAIQLFSTSPALFIENQGQRDESVQYGFMGSGTNIAFTDKGLRSQLVRRKPVEDGDDGEPVGDPMQGFEEDEYVTEATSFPVSFHEGVRDWRVQR